MTTWDHYERHMAEHDDMPLFEREPWERHAACTGADQRIFFPAAVRNSTAKAKAICATCTVRAECLEFAQRTRQTHGVWGGLDVTERRALRAPRRTVVRVDGQRPGPKPWRPCGTTAAYQRHLRHGEEPCQPCRDANTAAVTAANNRRRRDPS